MAANLSKSKLMAFSQCAKQLFLQVHRPELAETSPQLEAIFAMGHQVGDVAIQTLGGGNGHYIEYEQGLGNALAETAALMTSKPRLPIYEATFEHDGVLVRVDLLMPEGAGWRIVEVKSTTRVKDQHPLDCAIQAWVFRQCGYRLSGVSIAHIDNTFVYAGDGDYHGLLVEKDVTDAVRELESDLPTLVAQAKATLANDEPSVAVGRHCTSPYDCAFRSHCWPSGTRYPVQGLGGSKALLGKLIADGFEDIRQVPVERLSSQTHKRIQRITVAEEAELLPGAKAFAGSLAYPRYYLDFETIGPAVPIWAGTRPYEMLPVQWSCHIEHEDGTMLHREFLDLSGEPPMHPLAESLIDALSSAGPILMYTDFEKWVIRALADRYPDLATSLERIVDRLVDLAPVARQNYYHPRMAGSWSIKSVLPTLAPDMDYEHLEGINEGQAASAGYLEAISPGTGAARRAELEHQLLRYCRFDTEAMVRLVRFFAEAPVAETQDD